MRKRLFINFFVAFPFLVTLCRTAFADDKISIDTPEIPAGSAPFLLAGLLGLILWTRNFFSKK